MACHVSLIRYVQVLKSKPDVFPGFKLKQYFPTQKQLLCGFLNTYLRYHRGSNAEISILYVAEGQTTWWNNYSFKSSVKRLFSLFIKVTFKILQTMVCKKIILIKNHNIFNLFYLICYFYFICDFILWYFYLKNNVSLKGDLTIVWRTSSSSMLSISLASGILATFLVTPLKVCKQKNGHQSYNVTMLQQFP